MFPVPQPKSKVDTLSLLKDDFKEESNSKIRFCSTVLNISS